MPFLPPNQQRQSTEGTGTEGTEPKKQKVEKKRLGQRRECQLCRVAGNTV